MRKYIFAATGLALLLVIGGCSKFTGKTAPEKAEPQIESPQVTAVQTYVVGTGSLVSYHDFGGDVYPVSTMNIVPDTTGKVVSLTVREGSVVKKDQVIAQIDQSKPGLNYNTSAVKAPMDGTVVSLTAQVGALAGPSMPFGTVASTDDLEIRFSVVERYLALVRTGQRAFVTFDAYPDEQFPATIVRMSPVLDRSSRTRTVYCTLDTPDDRVISGMYAKIKVVTDQKQDVVTVPSGAIVTDDGERFVFVVADSVAAKVPVTTGIEGNGMVEIVSGLEVGQQIVVKGQNLLADGVQVTVTSTVGGEN